MTVLKLCYPSRHHQHGLDTIQKRQSMLVKKLPSVGQAQRTGPAFEKHHAQLFLELVDLPTERRLGHLQRLRGTRDAPLSNHGHEIAEVAQFHSIPSG